MKKTCLGQTHRSTVGTYKKKVNLQGFHFSLLNHGTLKHKKQCRKTFKCIGNTGKNMVLHLKRTSLFTLDGARDPRIKGHKVQSLSEPLLATTAFKFYTINNKVERTVSRYIRRLSKTNNQPIPYINATIDIDDRTKSAISFNGISTYNNCGRH